MQIGNIVQYFIAAEKSNKPVAAVVTDIASNGLVNLSLISNGGGEMGFRKNIRHVEDPFLKEHPERARIEGAWDYVPKENEIVGYVAELASEHDFDGVFKRVRSKGITKAKLKQIYESNGLQTV